MKEKLHNKKVWVVFSWWWVNGFLYAWIIKYLEEQGIKPVIVWWTSIGSIFSLLLAGWYEYEKILEYINDLESRIDTIKDIDWKSISKSTLKLSLNDTKALLKWKKTENELKKILKIKNIDTFTDLKIPYFLHKVNINNGDDVCVFSLDEKYKEKGVIDYLRASISLPWVFKPHFIDWAHYIDWGIRSNFPMLSCVKLAENSNIPLDVVLSVNIMENYSDNLDYQNASFLDILLRSINIAIQDQHDSDTKLFKKRYPHIELMDLKIQKIFTSSLLTAEVSKAIDYWYNQIKNYLEN